MYYDWQRAFTYDADVTMVIGRRRCGKTWGLREQLLRDYIQRGERCVIVTRYRNAVKRVGGGYFEKVLSETEDKKICAWRDARAQRWRTTEETVDVAFQDPETEKWGSWQTVGYLVWMSVKQDAKERSFNAVRRIVLDEAIIEPDDMRYRNYLSNEWGRLSSIVDSCSREAGKRHKPNVYLLANAGSVDNPWFSHYKIYSAPDFGTHWYPNRSFLLDVLDPARYGPPGDSVAERMLAGTADAARSYGNVIEEDMCDFIAKKTRGARYEMGFIYFGRVYGVWTDYGDGLVYVNHRFLKDSAQPMYALTTRDNRVNYLTGKAARKALGLLMDRYSLGIVRFETDEVMRGFLDMMHDYGLK